MHCSPPYAAEITDKYTEVFMSDLASLNILPADHYPKATDYIREIVEMIQGLESKGLAYKNDDGWWYSVSSDPSYGKRVASVPLDPRSPPASDADFALWKAEKPGVDVPTALWDTPLGRGRPGWHIECSAIAKALLPPQIDIHAGGEDLKFPHHENEAAQCTGVGGEGWCGCWVHNGFVNVGSEFCPSGCCCQRTDVSHTVYFG